MAATAEPFAAGEARLISTGVQVPACNALVEATNARAKAAALTTDLTGISRTF